MGHGQLIFTMVVGVKVAEQKPMEQQLDVYKIKMIKKKFILVISLFNLVVFKTTAQNTYVNTSLKEIQSSTNPFDNLNYSNPQLFSSGLIYNLIEKHFLEIQQGGLTETTKYKEMTSVVDIILDGVKKNEKLYNDLTKYLFQYFEKYSLFPASEYIALKSLNQKEVSLNSALVNKLESYRKMKVGNRATNFEMVGDVFKNGTAVKAGIHLTDINAKYKLVIFGGSWCPQCRAEMIQLLPLYNNWKVKGIEVVFVSLDTDKNEFENFAASFPFYSSCDYKKWETQAAKDYYVSSSPTLFLLDSNNKIILRPPTVASLDSWLQNK
jgi:thiol-disulfide isomerase/thioredoxin